MATYRIIIGNRELDVQAPSLEEAVHRASLEYPGEAISGFYAIPEAEGEEEDENGN